MAVIRSLELLYLLGALTDEKKLSDPIGCQMARLPLEPNDSKALILASQFDCLEEMLIIVAMLSVESIFYAPREKLEEVRTIFPLANSCFRVRLVSRQDRTGEDIRKEQMFSVW